MKISRQEEIAGVGILEVRAFLRKHRDWGLDLPALQQAFGSARGTALLGALLMEQYVEQVEEAGCTRFGLTVRGGALARATAAKQVKRKTAEKALEGFLVRCEQARGRGDLLYRVRRVVLFGSMLTDAQYVSDVDLAVELAPKEDDREKQLALEKRQARQAAEEGRRFSNIIDELYYPRRKVLLFLKARSPVLQFSDAGDGVLERANKKVVFQDLG